MAAVVELDERAADVAEPSRRLESDVPGLADHDEPIEFARRTVEPPDVAIVADPVLYDEMALDNEPPLPLVGSRCSPTSPRSVAARTDMLRWGCPHLAT